MKKLIVRTSTFSECDGHEPILTGQVGAVNNEDLLGQPRVTCNSGRVRRQRTSATPVVIEWSKGSQKLIEGKSITWLSASFCRVN